MAGTSGKPIVTHKQLLILQWFNTSTFVNRNPENPDGWCRESRLEKEIKLDGKRFPMTEALFGGEESCGLVDQIVGQREPFLIVNQSTQKHFRLSTSGRRIAMTCELAPHPILKPKQHVVDRKTKQPPRLTTAAALPPGLDDDEDDDGLPTAPAELDAADEPVDQPAALDDFGGESLEDQSVEDSSDTPARDEINDPPLSPLPAMTRKLPPAKNLKAPTAKPAKAGK